MPVIDPSWEQIQEGLYLEIKTINMSDGTTRTVPVLHSADGYCFYDNTLPEEERIYMQICYVGKYDSPDNYTSVVIEDWMEVVSVQKPPVKE